MKNANCKQCKHWDQKDNFHEKDYGTCTLTTPYKEGQSPPAFLWMEDPYTTATLTTHADFGCTGFQPR